MYLRVDSVTATLSCILFFSFSYWSSRVNGFEKLFLFSSNRNLQDEFESYQESVKKLGEEVKQVTTVQGVTQEAVCEICRKTKFADGVGHQCHYCHVKSCARCGGKMMLREKVS